MRAEKCYKSLTSVDLNSRASLPSIPARDFARYQDWVARGMAGEMRYLTDRRAEVRRDVRNLLPSAKSVICVGKLYNTPDPPRKPGDARISRYAWGKDYHVTMRAALERMVVRLLERRAVRLQDLRRYRAAAGAQLRAAGRVGLDRQEHLPDQRAAGIVVLSGRDRDISGARARLAAAGPLRELHALHRGLSHAGARARRRRLDTGRAPLHLLPDHRAARVRFPRNCTPGWATMFSAATSARTSARGTRGHRSPKIRTSRAPPFRWRNSRSFRRKSFANASKTRPIARATYAGLMRNVAVALARRENHEQRAKI